jgi:hypothetical protein
MTPRKDDEAKRDANAPEARPRQWVRPRVVAYGPISRLTRGNSGAKKDGTITHRH